MSRFPAFEVPGTPPQSQCNQTAYKAFLIAARFPRGCTVKQLMDAFGMSKPTAFRYRAAMAAAFGLDLSEPNGGKP